MWAVAVGSLDVRGVFFPEATKYVLLGTQEVAPSTYERAVWIHVLVIPIVFLVVGAVVFAAGARRRRNAPAVSASVPV